jgi:Lamin Tail Domain
MHTLRLRWARPRSAAALLAAAVGFAALAPAAPAAAATAPTIDQPAVRTGFGPITITGTATPGATVTLIEAAYVFRTDMYPAPNYDTGGVVTTVADSSGHYTIERTMDSGFVFAVEAEGVRSRVITVSIQVLPWITVSSDGSGTVNVGVVADPGQPGLPVEVQRAGSGDTWTTLTSGATGAGGAYSAVLTGQGTATQRYRAFVGADPDNAVLANYSATVDSTGAVISPAPTLPVATPTTPAPKPTTPPPVAPGDVQFSKIVYNSPGADTGSNTSLNGEYVRLTNKTKQTIDLRNWTIRDASGNLYRFSSSHLLGAGKTLYVHTGKGINGRPDSAHRYWGRTGYVWNNSGDTAILRTSSNRTIDSCKWGNGTGTTYC